MHRKNYLNKRKKVISFLYVILLCCFILLLTLVGFVQRNRVIQEDSPVAPRIVQAVKTTDMENDGAPAGTCREYILDEIHTERSNECLAFYLVHQYAQVYADEKLIYSLMPANMTFLSRDTGCNWAVIPLEAELTGKHLRVIVTPAYQEVKNRTTQFLVGSQYKIFEKTVREDIPDILLSLLSICLGAGFMAISLISLLQRKGKSSLIYLGATSAFMGIWKLFDIRSASILFYRNPMLISQISLAALSLAGVPFAVYIGLQFKERKHRILELACGISLVSTGIQLVLQLMGVMDLRESLQLSHASIAVIAVAVLLVVFTEWQQNRRNKKVWITLGFFFLCAVGVCADILLFYVNGNSLRLLNALALFIIYIFFMGSMTLVDMNQKAVIDYPTGLYNRSRCHEVLKEETELEKGVCLMMFDLNRLKHVNDTLGHEAGDEMISRFAQAIQQAMPAAAFLGRYGGDEFIAVIRKCTHQNAEDILKNLEETVEQDNILHPDVTVQYAAGYALSDEWPESNMKMLLEKADYAMYEHKKAYYERISKK